MPKLIKDGVLADNEWTLLSDAEAEVPATGKVIVALPVWQAQRDALLARGDVAVWLESTDDVGEFGADAEQLPLVAVNFPAFADGRGFSIGRLLRERYNFSGELRAVGNFIRDQLCNLKRCGFNAFDCNPDIDQEAAIASLSDFTEAYQSSVDQPTPLFRRR